MGKQDRQGVRNPADIERKYDLGKNLAKSMGSATEANKNAHEANQAVSELANKTLLADEEIKAYVNAVEAQAVYTAMMTDTLLESESRKDKISNWYTLSLWTEAMVNKAVEKGVLTSDEATEILSEGVITNES